MMGTTPDSASSCLRVGVILEASSARVWHLATVEDLLTVEGVDVAVVVPTGSAPVDGGQPRPERSSIAARLLLRYVDRRARSLRRVDPGCGAA